MNSLLIFYQLINNLFSRASRPEPRLGRQWKKLKNISSWGFSTTPLLFDLQLHAWCLCWWQKRSKYQPLFFLNFQKWCYKSFLYTANKKSKLIGTPSNITNPSIPPCVMIRWVMQTIWFDFTNTRHVLAGNFSAKLHGRFRCHIWIQYGPCITTLTFLIYVHSMFHHSHKKRKDSPETRAGPVVF